MKLTRFAAALATAAFMGQASAALMIDGIAVPTGLVFNTITLFEGEDLTGPGNGNFYIDQVGERLLGIGIVNQILDSKNNIVWANGQNGRELTFVISNYIADSFTNTPIGSSFFGNILFSGGQVQLFSQVAGTLQTGALTQAAAVASATAGNLWLDLMASTFGGLTGLGNNTTLDVNVISNNPNPFIQSTNVTGRGFLDVAGGLAGANFDTNTKGRPGDDADLTFTSSGQLLAPGNAGPWGFRGTGEVEAFTVPVPGSLALAGLGLLALGGASRLRRGKSS